MNDPIGLPHFACAAPIGEISSDRCFPWLSNLSDAQSHVPVSLFVKQKVALYLLDHRRCDIALNGIACHHPRAWSSDSRKRDPFVVAHFCGVLWVSEKHVQLSACRHLLRKYMSWVFRFTYPFHVAFEPGAFSVPNPGRNLTVEHSEQ